MNEDHIAFLNGGVCAVCAHHISEKEKVDTSSPLLHLTLNGAGNGAACT